MKKIVWHGSELMLRLIDIMLRRAKVQLGDIVGILVVRGPGPFTAVRTGLVLSNTLGLVLAVPVRGVVSAQTLRLQEICHIVQQWRTAKIPSLVRPWYGREPHITLPHATTQSF